MAEGLVAPLRSPITSGQETAREPRGAIVRVEVHVKIAWMGKQLVEASLRRGEMRARYTSADLPDAAVPIREVKVRAQRPRQPPDDWTRGPPALQMAEMGAAGALT